MIKMVVCDIDGTIFNGVAFTKNLWTAWIKSARTA